jgi:hypothetical protein
LRHHSNPRESLENPSSGGTPYLFCLAEGHGPFCNFKFISLKLLGFYVQLFRRQGADETILLRHETIFPFSCRRPETIANLQFFPTKRRKAANWEIVNAERRSHQ